MTPSAKLTGLLVDDNEMNRLTLEHLIELTPELELVASFSNAVDCLAFFREGGKVDVVFLDIEMPLLAGLDLKSAVIHANPTITSRSKNHESPSKKNSAYLGHLNLIDTCIIEPLTLDANENNSA